MGWLSRWPLIRQIRQRKDGTGLESRSARTEKLHARTDGAEVARSVCPYCGVGCGQLVYHRDGQVLAIEGDPASPISQGNLCPKGACSHQLVSHDRRLTRVLYRPPRGTAWQELDLGRAMDLVAQRLWETRARTLEWERDGQRLNQTTAIAHIGGATLDNEENYLIKKLFTAGLGMVAVTNQARI